MKFAKESEVESEGEEGRFCVEYLMGCLTQEIHLFHIVAEGKDIEVTIPCVSLVIILITLAFFIINLIQFLLKANLINKQIASCNAFTRNLGVPESGLSTDQYNELHEQLQSQSAMSYSWKEMRETIITVKKQNVSYYYNSLQSEAFFNEKAVFHEIPGWIGSVPGILTGLGLLGTFLALLIGLASLHVSGDGNVAGIDAFINSLSGKFLSSIAGLGCALLFTFCERSYMTHLENGLYKLQHTLNRLFPRTTSEKILSETLLELQRQTEPLEAFGTTVAESLNNSLAQNITPEIGKMINAIEKLNETTEALRQQNSESIVETFQKTMDEFRQTLTGAANTEIQGLAQSLSSAASFLEGLDSKNQGMEERMSLLFGQLDTTMVQQREQSRAHAEELQNAMTSLLSRLEGSSVSSMEAFQGQIAQVIEQTSQWSGQMEGRLKDMSEALSSGSQKQREQMQEQVQTLAETVSELVQNLEQSARSQQAGITQHLESLISKVEANTQTQSEQLSKHHNELNRHSTEWLNDARSSLESILEKQHSLASSLSEAGAQLDASTRHFDEAMSTNASTFKEMKNTITQLQDTALQLKNATKDSGESHEQLLSALNKVGNLTGQFGSLLQETEKLQRDQKQVYETLERVLGGVLKEVQLALEGYTNSMSGSLNTYGQGIDSQMKEALSLLSGTVETLDGQLSELTDVLERKLQPA